MTVYDAMAGFADRNEPLDRFVSDSPCIPQVMNISGAGATVYTSPIVPPKYHKTLSSPIVGLKIYVPVIVATSFSSYFEYPTTDCQYDN